ncbi:MAG: efflux transporter outer membrane subunit [Sphingomonadales bacterium]|nr:efflux transporter outer membrane subunit [Sphingomonadales bacterium]MDE2570725.1 efflux transporter outer membrane subunit [Sphingomonadales bacterium]
MKHCRAYLAAAPALLALALAGCGAIGDSDPHAQLPPAPGAGAPLDPAVAAGAPAQVFEPGVTTPRAWWTAFGCDSLDALVGEALAHNNDLAAADAALRAAEASAKAAGSALVPSVDVGYTAQRARTAASLAPPVTDASQLLYSLHTAQVTVSYPVDLFGGLHARRRSAVAAAKVAQAHLLAARQSVAANLVVALVGLTAVEDQASATRAMIASGQEALGFLRQRLRLGDAGDADVTAQEAALASMEGQLPALDRAAAHQRAVIAALLGRAPGSAMPALPTFACFAVPGHLPVAFPADVVRYRPDVMAAAATVEGAAADAHAAVAARFPSLTLSATGGGTAQALGDMFDSPNLFWSVVGGITAPLFHSGALRHQQDAAIAMFDQSKAEYRATVLQAFVDVSDALQGLHDDAATLDAAQRGEAAAQQSYGFAVRQQKLGEVGALALLNAQAALDQARSQTIAARSARLVDTVALFQANGAQPSLP